MMISSILWIIGIAKQTVTNFCSVFLLTNFRSYLHRCTLISEGLAWLSQQVQFRPYSFQITIVKLKNRSCMFMLLFLYMVNTFYSVDYFPSLHNAESKLNKQSQINLSFVCSTIFSFPSLQLQLYLSYTVDSALMSYFVRHKTCLLSIFLLL